MSSYAMIATLMIGHAIAFMPEPCCEAATAECEACQLGMTAQDFCMACGSQGLDSLACDQCIHSFNDIFACPVFSGLTSSPELCSTATSPECLALSELPTTCGEAELIWLNNCPPEDKHLLFTIFQCAASLPRTCEEVSGYTRCWSTYVPDGVTQDTPAPLVVAMHGLTSSAELSYMHSGWKEVADEHSLVVVYPQGLGTWASWNVGEVSGEPNCCGSAGFMGVDDVGFIQHVMETFVSDVSLSIDSSRVYLAGWSNGCALAQAVAAQASDMVAGVVCHAMYLLMPFADDYSSVPIIEIHGDADETVTYDPWAVQNIQNWAFMNGCQSSSTTTHTEYSDTYTILRHTDCIDGGDVVLMTLEGVGHNPYTSSPLSPLPVGTDVPTTALGWDFISQYTNGGGGGSTKLNLKEQGLKQGLKEPAAWLENLRWPRNIVYK